MVTYFYPTNNKKIQPTREPQRTGPKETTLIIFHLNRHTWIKKFRIIVKNKKQCHRILLHSTVILRVTHWNGIQTQVVDPQRAFETTR